MSVLYWNRFWRPLTTLGQKTLAYKQTSMKRDKAWHRVNRSWRPAALLWGTGLVVAAVASFVTKAPQTPVTVENLLRVSEALVPTFATNAFFATGVAMGVWGQVRNRAYKEYARHREALNPLRNECVAALADVAGLYPDMHPQQIVDLALARAEADRTDADVQKKKKDLREGKEEKHSLGRLTLAGIATGAVATALPYFFPAFAPVFTAVASLCNLTTLGMAVLWGGSHFWVKHVRTGLKQATHTQQTAQKYLREQIRRMDVIPSVQNTPYAKAGLEPFLDWNDAAPAVAQRLPVRKLGNHPAAYMRRRRGLRPASPAVS